MGSLFMWVDLSICVYVFITLCRKGGLVWGTDRELPTAMDSSRPLLQVKKISVGSPGTTWLLTLLDYLAPLVNWDSNNLLCSPGTCTFTSSLGSRVVDDIWTKSEEFQV